MVEVQRRSGADEGRGHNHNFPPPHGTAWDSHGPTLEAACKVAEACRPDAIVVSLGVDTSEDDPISRFRRRSGYDLRIGERIAALGRPVLFEFEGGYAVDAVGVNTVNVPSGFEGAAG